MPSVPYPSRANRLDYEGEVAIILGKQGKDVPAAEARELVWGVTLLGDWSIRSPAEPQGPLKFGMAKNFDQSCSLGPCIVVGELDPSDIEVETWVNGERRQQFNTRDMVFSYWEYIEYLSRDLTLYPGDIISGGTAAGTAADSSPRLADGQLAPERFLKAGDVVEIQVADYRHIAGAHCHQMKASHGTSLRPGAVSGKVEMGFCALPIYGKYGNERAATRRMGRAQRNPSSQGIAWSFSSGRKCLARGICCPTQILLMRQLRKYRLSEHSQRSN